MSINLIVGIILTCIGIIWGYIGINETYKINKKNNGIPLDNAVALIIFFIIPSIILIVCGFALIMIHIYS